jgi:hypothetical protein
MMKGQELERPMSPLIVIRLFSFWQMQAVAAALILFLPLVCYLASVRPRGRRRREFVAPADKAAE